MNLSLPSPAGPRPTQSIRLVLSVVMVWSVGSSVVAQLPAGSNADPRGWQQTDGGPTDGNPALPGVNGIPLRSNQTAAIEVEPQNWEAPLNSNEPVRLNSNEPVRHNQALSSHLDDDIRRQIGLASFDEGVESPSRSPAPPRDITPHDEVVKPTEFPFANLLSQPAETLTAPNGIQGSLKFALLIGALSLAPAIILMTTCYIRVVVVLSLLKQAFGGQQLPPAQVLTALSLFLTFLIMTPVWNELKTTAIDPYAANEIQWDVAWQRGVAPIKSFMVRQIQLAGNEESVAVFYKYADVGSSLPPSELNEVPLNVLIPAFMISELKVAFLLGFQIYLPFLVLDLIVSSVTVSMGMLMMPPQMVSFPLKLILFVLVDGWNLVIGMLLQSFGALM